MTELIFFLLILMVFGGTWLVFRYEDLATAVVVMLLAFYAAFQAGSVETGGCCGGTESYLGFQILLLIVGIAVFIVGLYGFTTHEEELEEDK